LTYDAVAFDLDSTLSYYPLSTRDVLRQALRRVGQPDLLPDLDAAAHRYDAAWSDVERRCASVLETRTTLWKLLLGDADDALCERLAVAYDEIRRETGVHLYPGVEAMLRALAGRYRLGLLTNGSTEMQWEKLKDLGIETLFDAIVVAGDHGIYKPDRRVFELLANRLGCPPERVLFVGDNYDADVRGAHDAGMRTAWLRHPGAEPSDPICHDIELEAIAELEARCL